MLMRMSMRMRMGMDEQYIIFYCSDTNISMQNQSSSLSQSGQKQPIKQSGSSKPNKYRVRNKPEIDALLKLTHIQIIFISLHSIIQSFFQLLDFTENNKLKPKVFPTLYAAQNNKDLWGRTVAVVTDDKTRDILMQKDRESVWSISCLHVIVNNNPSVELQKYVGEQLKMYREYNCSSKQLQISQDYSSEIEKKSSQNDDDDSSDQGYKEHVVGNSSNQERAKEYSYFDDIKFVKQDLSRIFSQNSNTQEESIQKIRTELRELKKYTSNFVKITNNTNKKYVSQYHQSIYYVINQLKNEEYRSQAFQNFIEFLSKLPDQLPKQVNNETHYIQQCLQQYEKDGNYTSILKLYSRNNPFHVSIGYYSKFYFCVPYGIVPLQFPIMLMMESIKLQFIAKIPQYIKQKSEGDLRVFRGCQLTEDEKKMFESCVGDIIQHVGFMSTSTEIEQAIKFAGKRKYLVQVTVKHEDFAYYTQFEDHQKGVRVRQDKIQLGEGFIFIEDYSQHPHEKEVLFNLLNYYKICGVRQQIIKTSEGEDTIYTIYVLEYVNPMRLVEVAPISFTGSELRKQESIERQFVDYYRHQSLVKKNLVNQTDLLLWGEYNKQALDQLLQQTRLIMQVVCPKFDMREYRQLVEKGLMKEKDDYSKKYRECKNPQHALITPQQTAQYLKKMTHESDFTTGQIEPLLSVFSKYCLFYDKKLASDEMYAYAQLYLGFLKLSGNKLGVSKYEWEARGLIHLAGCYIMWGMYEISETLFRKAYVICERLQERFRNDDGFKQKLISRIFALEKLLEKKHDLQMIGRFYTLIQKNLADDHNYTLLQRFQNQDKFAEVLTARINNEQGKDTSAGFLSSFYNSFIKGNTSQSTKAEEWREIEDRKGIKRRILLELFGIYDINRIKKYISRRKEELKNIKQRQQKRVNSLKQLVEPVQRQSQLGGMVEKQILEEVYRELFVPYLSEEDKTFLTTREHNQQLPGLYVEAMPIRERLQRYTAVICLQIKHQASLTELEDQQAQEQLGQAAEQGLPEHYSRIKHEGDRLARAADLRTRSSSFLKSIQQQPPSFDESVRLYSEWRQSIEILFSESGDEQEGMLYSEWMLICSSLVQIADGFLVCIKIAQSQIKSTQGKANFLRSCFNKCLAAIEKVRYGSFQHIQLLDKYYFFQKIVWQINKNKQQNVRLGLYNQEKINYSQLETEYPIDIFERMIDAYNFYRMKFGQQNTEFWNYCQEEGRKINECIKKYEMPTNKYEKLMMNQQMQSQSKQEGILGVISRISDPYRQTQLTETLLQLLAVRLQTTEITTEFVEQEQAILQFLQKLLGLAQMKLIDKQKFVLSEKQKYEDTKLVMSFIFYSGFHSRLIYLYTQLVKYSENIKSPKIECFLRDSFLHYRLNQGNQLAAIQLRKLVSFISHVANKTHRRAALDLIEKQLKSIPQQIQKKDSLVQYLPNTYEQYKHYILAKISSFKQYVQKSQELSEMQIAPILLPNEFYQRLSMTPIQSHIEVLIEVCKLMSNTPKLSVWKVLHTIIAVIERIYQTDDKKSRGSKKEKYEIIYSSIEAALKKNDLNKEMQQSKSANCLMSAVMIFHLANIFCFLSGQVPMQDICNLMDRLLRKLEGRAGRDLLEFCGLQVKFVKLLSLNDLEKNKNTRKHRRLEFLLKALDKSQNNLLYNRRRLAEKLASAKKEQVDKWCKNYWSKKRESRFRMIQQKIRKTL